MAGNEPTTITNKSDNPLTFPGGEIIDARSTGAVANWEEAQKNPVVQAWLTDGMIAEGNKSESESDDEPDEDDEDDEDSEDADEEEEDK
jgi:hypothetical protein